ncbi:sterol desaturase family protein, partial [Klebsiella pneumoniae]|uniref:sterol desaturase family protein n=1 Tax=Klebsiella pneumoniae TaxID=573 RepID=UPI0035BE8AC8|nr:fatty acid hydroxylase [Klebsiella pneumoniae]
NTPSHHRVHHGSNPAYLDRNYGGMVIVFDRLFGTFAEEQAAEPVRFGLVHPLGSKNPVVVALGEWRRLLGDMARA